MDVNNEKVAQTKQLTQVPQGKQQSSKGPVCNEYIVMFSADLRFGDCDAISRRNRILIN